MLLLHDGGRWVLDYLYPEDKPFLKFGKIEIGNNNFFGARVIVNPGTRIGDNCVIAAGSIVTKDIPSGEVWGGGYQSSGLCQLMNIKKNLLTIKIYLILMHLRRIGAMN